MTSVRRNLKTVLERVQVCYASAAEGTRSRHPPRLVAVSKTKPLDLIIELYEEGHRAFGENYVQELVDKANHPDILDKCPDISWHFIGNLQSNKVSKVIKIPHLSVVETVTSSKLADKLNSSWADSTRKLQVMVQVNTSGEENKNGVEPEDVNNLVRHITDECPNLKFIGLMTIGDLGHSLASSRGAGEANPDFACLIQCRKQVSESLGVEEQSLELSMGMSNDFEEAIRMGSTNVRVGSTIFGERVYKRPDSPVKEVEQKLASTELK